MTTRSPVRREPPPPNRSERKADLEARIEQQRVDILVEASRWHEASRPLDDGWRTLMRFKLPLALAGVVLLRNRRTRHLLHYVRRLGTTALLFRRVRRLLH